MYTKSVPYKDLNGKPQNDTVHFHLFEREVFKLLGELQAVFSWYDSMGGGPRELETAAVVEFYNNFEEILLSAYGRPINDGLGFDHDGRYDFEKTACFNAIMVMMVTDPEETRKLIEGILPEGMEEIVRKADENLIKAAKETTDADLKAEIEALRAKLDAKESGEAQAS